MHAIVRAIETNWHRDSHTNTKYAHTELRVHTYIRTNLFVSCLTLRQAARQPQKPYRLIV